MWPPAHRSLCRGLLMTRTLETRAPSVDMLTCCMYWMPDHFMPKLPFLHVCDHSREGPSRPDVRIRHFFIDSNEPLSPATQQFVDRLYEHYKVVCIEALCHCFALIHASTLIDCFKEMHAPHKNPKTCFMYTVPSYVQSAHCAVCRACSTQRASAQCAEIANQCAQCTSRNTQLAMCRTQRVHFAECRMCSVVQNAQCALWSARRTVQCEDVHYVSLGCALCRLAIINRKEEGEGAVWNSKTLS